MEDKRKLLVKSHVFEVNSFTRLWEYFTFCLSEYVNVGFLSGNVE
jgi:hypothetical protein